MSKPKSKFTEEQQEILRQNPYTYSVSDTQISFTKEFKQLFYHEHKAGKSPRDIFTRHGYDPHLLGEHRVYAFPYHLKQQMTKFGAFFEGHYNLSRKDQPGQVSDQAALSQEEKIKRLEHEVSYLKQEMEFLKKISSIKATRK